MGSSSTLSLCSSMRSSSQEMSPQRCENWTNHQVVDEDVSDHAVQNFFGGSSDWLSSWDYPNRKTLYMLLQKFTNSAFPQTQKRCVNFWFQLNPDRTEKSSGPVPLDNCWITPKNRIRCYWSVLSGNMISKFLTSMNIFFCWQMSRTNGQESRFGFCRREHFILHQE